MFTAALTIGIGGSGGVFGPSLFIGASSGMAFGEIANHLIGASAGQPALYAVVGMGAVFAAAARGPLTALASVVEMTGDFTLTLPVMLAVAISTTISRSLSYGTIYTQKLIRRGTDIDRVAARHALDALSVADAMYPFATAIDTTQAVESEFVAHEVVPRPDLVKELGPVTRTRAPQALFSNDNLAQALRQLVLYGRDGLPVIGTDGLHLQGWITNQHVLGAVARRMASARAGITAGHRAAGWANPEAADADHDPGTALPGYRVIEHTLTADSAAVGKKVEDVVWPIGHRVVSILHNRRLVEPKPSLTLAEGDRISMLVPTQQKSSPDC